jgi:two-component system LytT family response regulator
MSLVKPISCLIVDDEFPAVKLLADYVNKTPGLELLLKTTSALEALDFLQTHRVDVLFLDIQMPELTGIELLNIIKNTSTRVVLTTAYTEYAIEGFEKDVADYLLKPITFERFLTSVSKVQSRINAEKLVTSDRGNQNQEFIFVKTEYRMQKVNLSSIHYIEGLGDYITLHTTSGKILSLERMKQMDVLLTGNFLRIHKSFLVNIEHIDFIEKGRIVIGRQYLPIGESYKENVRVVLKF